MSIGVLKTLPRKTGLNAVSKAKSTTTTSTYVDVKDCEKVYAIFNFGACDSGTATMNFLQATDTSGTGSKALTAGNFAQATNATDNTTVQVEEFVNKMDGANGFDCIAMQVVWDANVATAAFFHCSLWGVDPTHKN